MARAKDLTNRTIGFLTIVKRVDDAVMHNGKKYPNWECLCICGNTTNVISSNLIKCEKTGIGTKSCGCKTSELCSKANITHGHNKSKMGKRKRSREWCTHRSMLDRCIYPSHKAYGNYGGRGIIVCDRWLKGENGKSGFNCFLDDMGLKPEGYTLEREDTNGNYEPSNCIWATRTVNNKNRRPGHEWHKIKQRRLSKRTFYYAPGAFKMRKLRR